MESAQDLVLHVQHSYLKTIESFGNVNAELRTCPLFQSPIASPDPTDELDTFMNLQMAKMKSLQACDAFKRF